MVSGGLDWHRLVILFSMDGKDAEMVAVEGVRMGEENLRAKKNPTFLGITYDRTLRFGDHLRKIYKKARKAIVLLRTLSGKDWGWDRKLMRQTYLTVVRPIIMYGATAWTPWVSDTGLEELEKVQREAARAITGMGTSSPREALGLEADLQEVRHMLQGQWMVEYEKSRRAMEGNPRKELVGRQVNQRLKWKGWREKCKNVIDQEGYG
jgi:hypothetical protein